MNVKFAKCMVLTNSAFKYMTVDTLFSIMCYMLLMSILFSIFLLCSIQSIRMHVHFVCIHCIILVTLIYLIRSYLFLPFFCIAPLQTKIKWEVLDLPYNRFSFQQQLLTVIRACCTLSHIIMHMQHLSSITTCYDSNIGGALKSHIRTQLLYVLYCKW